MIEQAIAEAEANVVGVGKDAQDVVAQAIAEALAAVLAEAVAEVFCDP